MANSVSRALLEVRFQSMRREQNKNAYELARLANRTYHSISGVWRAQVPQCVVLLIMRECNGFLE
jgi:hypothetical protein